MIQHWGSQLNIPKSTDEINKNSFRITARQAPKNFLELVDLLENDSDLKLNKHLGLAKIKLNEIKKLINEHLEDGNKAQTANSLYLSINRLVLDLINKEYKTEPYTFTEHLINYSIENAFIPMARSFHRTQALDYNQAQEGFLTGNQAHKNLATEKFNEGINELIQEKYNVLNTTLDEIKTTVKEADKDLNNLKSINELINNISILIKNHETQSQKLCTDERYNQLLSLREDINNQLEAREILNLKYPSDKLISSMLKAILQKLELNPSSKTIKLQHQIIDTNLDKISADLSSKINEDKELREKDYQKILKEIKAYAGLSSMQIGLGINPQATKRVLPSPALQVFKQVKENTKAEIEDNKVNTAIKVINKYQSLISFIDADPDKVIEEELIEAFNIYLKKAFVSNIDLFRANVTCYGREPINEDIIKIKKFLVGKGLEADLAELKKLNSEEITDLFKGAKALQNAGIKELDSHNRQKTHAFMPGLKRFLYQQIIQDANTELKELGFSYSLFDTEKTRNFSATEDEYRSALKQQSQSRKKQRSLIKALNDYRNSLDKVVEGAFNNIKTQHQIEAQIPPRDPSKQINKEWLSQNFQKLGPVDQAYHYLGPIGKVEKNNKIKAIDYKYRARVRLLQLLINIKKEIQNENGFFVNYEYVESALQQLQKLKASIKMAQLTEDSIYPGSQDQKLTEEMKAVSKALGTELDSILTISELEKELTVLKDIKDLANLNINLNQNINYPESIEKILSIKKFYSAKNTDKTIVDILSNTETTLVEDRINELAFIDAELSNEALVRESLIGIKNYYASIEKAIPKNIESDLNETKQLLGEINLLKINILQQSIQNDDLNQSIKIFTDIKKNEAVSENSLEEVQFQIAKEYFNDKNENLKKELLKQLSELNQINGFKNYILNNEQLEKLKKITNSLMKIRATELIDNDFANHNLINQALRSIKDKEELEKTLVKLEKSIKSPFMIRDSKEILSCFAEINKYYDDDFNLIQENLNGEKWQLIENTLKFIKELRNYNFKVLADFSKNHQKYQTRFNKARLKKAVFETLVYLQLSNNDLNSEEKRLLLKLNMLNHNNSDLKDMPLSESIKALLKQI